MNSTLTDPTIIRAFILHDALLKIPFSEGYKNLQKIVGDDVVSYADYDFWYHRFYSGNLDLNYDRSADPSPPMLEELPIEILDAILGNLDFENRFKVRKVSKTMRHVVDQLKTVLTYLEIRFFEDRLCMSIRGNIAKHIKYIEWPDGECKIEKNYETFRMVRGNHFEIGLHDLSILLKSPKFRIGTFIVEDEDSGAFQQVLDTLEAARNSKIHVANAEIKVKDSQDAMALLDMLKPGALESLKIQIPDEVEPNMLGSLKDMEQFRQLKSVDLSWFGAIPAIDLPNFYEFEDFKVHVKTMSTADVLSLRKNFSNADNKTKSCNVFIQTAANVVEIGRALGEKVEEKDWLVVHTCSIDNSELVLKFQIQENQVRVSKVDTTLPIFHAYGSDSDDDYDFLSDEFDEPYMFGFGYNDWDI